MLRAALIGVALLYGFISTITAQEQPGVAIRAETTLVLVDVMARNTKTQEPEKDLKKEDFRLFDNGKEVPIEVVDSGTQARPIALWLAVICNEQFEGSKRSGLFSGKESLLRDALNDLAPRDTAGVAHWCDNGEAKLNVRATTKPDEVIAGLANALEPVPFVPPAGTRIGEVTLQAMVRLIVVDARLADPQPMPVIVFLHSDYTGMPKEDLSLLTHDFLTTSGVAFGIKNSKVPGMPSESNEATQVLHYLAEETGGEYFSVPEERYAATLSTILGQVHFRYQLAFRPAALDGKRHTLKVELTKTASKQHKNVKLFHRAAYLASKESTAGAR